jgi:hypothetical protein
MFKNLLTPFRSRFEDPPQSLGSATVPGVQIHGDDGEFTSPEDFARDVLIQLMRNSMENLKAADDVKSKSEASTTSSSLSPP